MTDEEFLAAAVRPTMQMVLSGLKDAGVYLPIAQQAAFIEAVEARRMAQLDDFLAAKRGSVQERQVA